MMDKISTQYNQAVQLIKSAILQNQLEAAKAVNRQMLALYYGYKASRSYRSIQKVKDRVLQKYDLPFRHIF